MKKFFIVALACILVAMSFTGCSSKGKTLMSLDGSEISVNMFQLFLSRQKGMLCSSYGYGSKALADSFWDTVMDVSGTTYNDYYTELVLENAKTYLAALKLFDERGLKLPDSYIDEIDAELDRLVDQDGSGSKATFNSVLAEFGVNYNILREAYIIEAKIAYLQDELFGVGGSKISEQLIEDYFSQQYVRFKQVFLYTYGTVYETDENGDNIYFNEDGTVAYDTTATPKKDADGNFVRDSKGNVIYLA